MPLKKFTLAELSILTESTLIGSPEHEITGVEALDSAGQQDASFLANPRYRSLLKEAEAGVVCIDRSTPPEEGKNYLVSDDPSRAFQIILEALLISSYNQSGFEEIHPTAVIHTSAKIGKGVRLGPYVVIDQGAVIGDHTELQAFVSIGPGVEVGSNCLFYPHVIVREKCTIGNRVILQPGAVIGSCGFGFSTDALGKHTKLDQLGSVVIEDDVEIGANTAIDRARFKSTVISKGTKIDNLVQIGHNVHIGTDNIIVSQTGIAGSVKTGKNNVFGGQAGVVGHLEITDYVMIATRGGVSKSILKSGKYAGSPVMGLSEYNRQQVHLRKIEGYIKQIDALEKRLQALEEKVPLSFTEN
jgi:UDP-3-O-[3-hydroxymyristoyl] glucosamine N-acyltransferase